MSNRLGLFPFVAASLVLTACVTPATSVPSVPTQRALPTSAWSAAEAIAVVRADLIRRSETINVPPCKQIYGMNQELINTSCWRQVAAQGEIRNLRSIADKGRWSAEFHASRPAWKVISMYRGQPFTYWAYEQTQTVVEDTGNGNNSGAVGAVQVVRPTSTPAPTSVYTSLGYFFLGSTKESPWFRTGPLIHA